MRLLMALMSLIISNSGYELDTYSYYKDATGSLSIDNINTVTFHKSDSNNLGIDSGVYWFEINERFPENSIIELHSGHVNDVSLYDSTGKTIQRMDYTRFPSYLANPDELSYPLYLRVNLPLEAYFPIKIYNEAQFSKNDKHSFLGIGFFYGTAIALLLATLTFFFIVRNTQFLVFAVAINAIILSVIAKHNILYFFGVSFEVISDIEALGHMVVGLSATCFMMFYLKLRPNQLWIKWSMLLMSSVSVLALFIFFITRSMLAYIAIDISALITVGLMWALILIIAKGWRRATLFVVYSINLFFITDIFIFHLYGIEVVKFGITGISVLSIANFTLIAVMLLLSFRNIQSRGVRMNHRIELYGKQLADLDSYKNIQDTNDDYLESLIQQFNLDNIEVKVLGDISKGLSNNHIAYKYNLTEEKLQSVTNSLYAKLGLESNSDIAQLAL